MAVEGAPDMELVVGLDVDDDIDRLSDDLDVVVDVTNVIAARQNLPKIARRAVSAVVGTSGLSAHDLTTLDAEFRANNAKCFVVPNFSIGALLMMRFAEDAAKYFGGAEIIELHHERKKDAPSGTALETARRIAAAEHNFVADPTEVTTVEGARGAEVEESLRIHSVRLPGLLAHQEIVMGADGQLLTIRHDSFDHKAFMPGVLQAIRGLDQLPIGKSVGLEAVL
jgi:4-hydroxy-tetrahydrodipicolinate reductase